MLTPPRVVPGHWSTPEGQEIAAEYLTKDRADLAHGEQTDLELANSIFMAGREDLSLIGFQEAAKQRIRWLSAQLAARDEQLRRTEAALAESPQGPLVYAPGHWECAKCGFGLVTSNLNMGDGSVTARDEPGEKCPNDGSPLWRVSWKGMAEEFAKRLEEQLERPGIRWPESGKLSHHEFEQVAGVIIGDEFVYPVKNSAIPVGETEENEDA